MQGKWCWGHVTAWQRGGWRGAFLGPGRRLGAGLKRVQVRVPNGRKMPHLRKWVVRFDSFRNDRLELNLRLLNPAVQSRLFPHVFFPRWPGHPARLQGCSRTAGCPMMIEKNTSVAHRAATATATATVHKCCNGGGGGGREDAVVARAVPARSMAVRWRRGRSR